MTDEEIASLADELCVPKPLRSKCDAQLQLELVTQYRELGATQVDFDAEGRVCRVMFPVTMVAAKLGVPRTDEPKERPPQRATAETSDEMRQARYRAILGG